MNINQYVYIIYLEAVTSRSKNSDVMLSHEEDLEVSGVACLTKRELLSIQHEPLKVSGEACLKINIISQR